MHHPSLKRASAGLIGSILFTHRSFVFSITISTLVFSAIITGGTFNFFEPESLGSYYDHLAKSMLDLRLDVPEVAIENEAMVFEGKYYGYFGPTPALLRLPLVMFNVTRVLS